MTTRQQVFCAVLLAGLVASLSLSSERARVAPRGQALRGPGVAAAPATPRPATDEAGAWWDDRVLIRPRPGARLDEIALDHGARVMKELGPSGLATLSLPKGSSVPAFLADLSADARVAAARPSGVVLGASSRSPGDYQWHLAAASVPTTGLDLSSVTVAVLDTGVAHAAGCAAAPSLEEVPVAPGWDFVNGDAETCDDHQHGTHVASLIASDGAVSGVAPGVTLMPVKVLDEDNTGDEQALVDGIAWATDGGADVINLSLAFSPGYAPSPELMTALREAREAGVLVVAAAGNDGVGAVPWPAASPLVIAVGAGALEEDGGIGPATYGNRGPEVDLLAPGGALDLDLSGDGYGDGMLAETIALGDPGSPGYWFIEGTSQAAAVVSGAAAALLAAGALPEEVLPTLQATSETVSSSPFLDGTGAGALNLEAALAAVEDGAQPEARVVHAAILPYLLREADGDHVVPTARVMVVDEDGEPLDRFTVVGRAVASGKGSRTWSCAADASDEGRCSLALAAVSDEDETGEPAALAWRFTVDAVVVDGVSWSPTPFLVATDGLEALAAGFADADLSGSTLAFSWEEEEDGTLGTLAAGLTLLDLGRGGASAPTALVLNEAMADQVFVRETLSLDLSGAGVATDALGVTAERVSTSGSGVATDALGVSSTSAGAVRGSGVSTDALGLTALSLLGSGESSDLGLGLGGTVVFPGETETATVLEDTWIEESFGLSSAPRVTALVHALAATDALDLAGAVESGASVSASGKQLR